MDVTDLCYTPATELATMIRRRQLSPVEIMDAILARIETLNPRLNAYLVVDAERAREQAKAAEEAVVRGDHTIDIGDVVLEEFGAIRAAQAGNGFQVLDRDR